MKKYNILIAVLGWEERFIKGIIDNLEKYNFEKLLLINFRVKVDATAKYKDQVIRKCNDTSIELIELNLNYSNSVESWLKMSNKIPKLVRNFDVLIDITTTPRETIWSLFHFMWNEAKVIDFVYHKPQCYDKKWLTKEPDKPRLLLQHSGIQRLDVQTALIILTGFELDRAKQLVYYFEPKLSILAIQSGIQFNNEERNKEAHKSLKEISEIEEFEIDGYSNDHGYELIDTKVKSLKDKYNIVIASLGPKPTAVSIYLAYLENPDIALAYVPNKDFNLNYSKGIGGTITGSVK